MLYAISGNAGWIVKPLMQDSTGWEMADFIVGRRENGAWKIFKNRRDGKFLEFLSVDAMNKYIQGYYDFSSTGVDVANIAFERLDNTNRGMFRVMVSRLIKEKNKSLIYKNDLDDWWCEREVDHDIIGGNS